MEYPVPLETCVEQVYNTLIEKLIAKVIDCINKFVVTFQLESLLGVDKSQHTVDYMSSMVAQNFEQLFGRHCKLLVCSLLRFKIQLLC